MELVKEYPISKRFPELPLLSAANAKKHPDLIPFAFGHPAKESFDISLLSDSAVSALQLDGPRALQYSGGAGPDHVVNWIQQRSKHVSIIVETQNILVTAGSMQAIDLATRTLTDPGDHVWVEAPTFFGAIRQFSLAEVKISSIPMDQNGLMTDELERKLKEAVKDNAPIPKFIYVMPNYHNPTGVCLSIERRKKLAELAYEYNFYILEDDAYVELSFSGEKLPSIYSFGPKRVIYLSTFSKTIAPGIRMGWALADDEVIIQRMKMLKSDGSTSVFVQEIISHFLADVKFEYHMKRINDLYCARKDAMINAVKECFGEEVAFTEPEGGFFLWLSFPKEVNTSEFASAALSRGVSFIESKFFYVDRAETNHIRLSFTFTNEEDIQKGVKRIAESYYQCKKSIEVLNGV
ncbi:PLP-dependent aminotransferase family protein [Niallia sp. JL1B1071]|uniref:aminotransferase-like domain-containing protein n=1 Tax=Niallia tiangongensis TaxID=3237105 RepID=UPI0037DBFAC6